MNDHVETNVVKKIKKSPSVRVEKGSSNSSKDELEIEGSITRFLGKSTLRTVFNISAVFLVLAFLSWEISTLSQAKSMSLAIAGHSAKIWNWFSSTCFFFYTMFLGLGLVSFFVYLTRRF